MSNLSVLRNALKLNAELINFIQYAIFEFKAEAARWKLEGETAYFIAANEDRRKHEKKLAKAIEMQKRTKAEIATAVRKEAIRRMFLFVFGKCPEQQVNTSQEQYKMLATLAEERRAALRLAKKAASVTNAA
jgi:hypothetical protein